MVLLLQLFQKFPDCSHLVFPLDPDSRSLSRRGPRGISQAKKLDFEAFLSLIAASLASVSVQLQFNEMTRRFIVEKLSN